MKRIIFLILAISLIVCSCSNEPVDPAVANSINNSNSNSSSGNTNSNSGVYMWKFKLNGVLYQWSGNHLTGGGVIAAGGQATYSVNAIALQKTNSSGSPILSVTMTFSTSSTGNFVFSSTGFNITLLNDAQQPTGMYTTGSGATMNVNISSLSNITFTSNPTNPGKVIGTFSGTVKSISGNTTATITEGTFEAVRGA